MRLSTSTNILYQADPTSKIYDVFHCLDLCSDAGYRVFDINCCDYSEPSYPLTRDDWESWALQVKKHADTLGVFFNQSHNPIYNVCQPEQTSDWEWKEELTRRSMITSAILGVEWVVVHAGTALPNGVYSKKETLERNASYFGSLADYAVSLGMKGIAIENMAYRGPWSNSLPPQLCATTDGLIELVDHIGQDSVGICWDFGHANLCNESQVDSLRRVGSRLKATHVNDNMGQADDHTLPFLGTLNWVEIMAVLQQIGYEGDLTYEIHKYLRRVPLDLCPLFVRKTVEVGNYLLDLATSLV
jgi:sugar phosphate isomerase/epimerase